MLISRQLVLIAALLLVRGGEARRERTNRKRNLATKNEHLEKPGETLADRLTRTLRIPRAEHNSLEAEAEAVFSRLMDDNDSFPPTDKPLPRPTRAPRTPNPTRKPTRRPTTEKPTSAPTEAPVIPATPKPVAAPTPSPVTPSTSSPTQVPIPATSLPTAPTPGSFAPTAPCNMSQNLRRLLLRIVVNSVSQSSDIETPDSPQSDAFNWIVDLDSRFLCPDDPDVIQRYTLAVFYFSTRGDRWSACSAPATFTPEAIAAANDACDIEPIPGSGSDAWLTPSNECLWGGVVCDQLEFGKVERIDFETNGLSGTLASELRVLDGLKFLLLEDGVTSGQIPSEYGVLTGLEVIDLNFNLIGGTIPEQIYALPNLRQLDLNDNLLSGTISDSIGNLTDLTFLQVQNNRMSGTIPSSLGNLAALGAATFQENQFEGSMPASVCALRDNGVLTTLTADCLELSGRPSPPTVACDCCTQCF